MADETPEAPKKPAKKAAAPKTAKPAAEKAPPKPRAAKAKPAADPVKAKVDKLADEALDAGTRITESATGKKVVDTAEQVFDKAEELVGKALDSETGKKVTAVAADLHKKALGTEAGKKVADTAGDLADKALATEAGQTAKKAWNTPLGRNVGVGTAAGAAVGLLIINPFVGALIGGGIGYLATLAKKSKKN